MTAVVSLAGRNLLRFTRSPQQAISAIVFPCLLLLILLAAFGDLVEATTGVGYLQQLVPLIVVASMVFGAAGSAIGVFTDMSGGFVQRLRTMSISNATVLGGRLAAELARTLLASVVVVAIGYAFGFRFRAGVLAALGFFAWAAIAVGVTGRNVESVGSALSLPGTLLLFLSSGFVPIQAFPDWAQPVVRANPLSCSTTALTALAEGGPTLWPVLQTIAWAVGLSVLFGVLALRSLGRH
jgi:ABC-2 type transport system permease protein